VAALNRKKATTIKHLATVAPMALRHRLRRNPLDDTGTTVRVERAIEEVLGA
jgi:magnesium chelatase subunit I